MKRGGGGDGAVRLVLMDATMATLLAGVVLVDTLNMDPAAKKGRSTTMPVESSSYVAPLAANDAAATLPPLSPS